jgi:hypothetical protein
VPGLDEVEGGIITRYAILEGNPPEADQLPTSLDHHRRVFKHPPRLLAGEWLPRSPANERYAATQGVQQIVLPKLGAKSAKRIAHLASDGALKGLSCQLPRLRALCAAPARRSPR